MYKSNGFVRPCIFAIYRKKTNQPVIFREAGSNFTTSCLPFVNSIFAGAFISVISMAYPFKLLW